jgi:phosphopantetheinyl transferase
MIVLPVPERWRRYAILVEEGPNELEDDSMFLPEELIAREAVSLPKRRREWTLSRRALKRLAVTRGVLGQSCHGLIESDSESRPRLRDLTTGRTWYVSLSHSRGFAAAAIDEAPIGVDVERVRQLHSSAAHLFLSDAEEEAITRAPVEEALLHGWCAKEAAWKAVSSMHETLRSVPLHLLEIWDHGLVFQSPRLTVETRRVSPALVAALARTV